MAKFSGKLRRTREETAEQTSLPGNLLSCFLLCAAGLEVVNNRLANDSLSVVKLNFETSQWMASCKPPLSVRFFYVCLRFKSASLTGKRWTLETVPCLLNTRPRDLSKPYQDNGVS